MVYPIFRFGIQEDFFARLWEVWNLSDIMPELGIELNILSVEVLFHLYCSVTLTLCILLFTYEN